ncbi:hypothetical protein, partial [Adlercreutzia muris]
MKERTGLRYLANPRGGFGERRRNHEGEKRLVLSRLLRKFQQPAVSRRHDHSPSSDTSRYLLDPHSLSATYL